MGVRERTISGGTRLLNRMPGPIRRNYSIRRAGHRLRRAGAGASPGAVPERPIGAKLELTYHCNLRCSFCYTDSPRRTLARTAEMSDESWHRIIDEAIELGVIEVVLTGGEPLLRPELTVWAAERFAEAGAMVTLNTNGWFMDEAIADSLAAAGARLHVSIDGASPELHDSSRGVPGGWRRAIAAADMALSRGMRVQVVNVVTPQNEATFGQMLEQVRLLGATSLRVVPVGRIGAASRGGEWDVNWPSILARVEQSAGPPRPRLLPGTEVQGALIAGERAPAAFLVRPNGAFLADSQHPFSFGHAAEQPLSECWGALRGGWGGERLESWRAGARNPKQAAGRDLVAYRDEEEVVAGVAPGAAEARKTGRELDRALAVLESKTPDPPGDGRGDIEGATETIRSLASSRRYRPGRSRWSGDAGGRRLVRVAATGKVHALNRGAGVVMDALDGGTGGDALEALHADNPDGDPRRIELDASDTIARLLDAGIIEPALAPAGAPSPGPDGTLDGLPG